MARDGLRKELPNAFQRALRSDEPIELRNIKIRNNNGDFNYATITIKQIESPDQLKGMVLIVFKEERESRQPHLPQQKIANYRYQGYRKNLSLNCSNQKKIC
jgi:two-component system CheB/CheR fusion protein